MKQKTTKWDSTMQNEHWRKIPYWRFPCVYGIPWTWRTYCSRTSIIWIPDYLKQWRVVSHSFYTLHGLCIRVYQRLSSQLTLIIEILLYYSLIRILLVPISSDNRASTFPFDYLKHLGSNSDNRGSTVAFDYPNHVGLNSNNRSTVPRFL